MPEILLQPDKKDTGSIFDIVLEADLGIDPNEVGYNEVADLVDRSLPTEAGIEAAHVALSSGRFDDNPVHIEKINGAQLANVLDDIVSGRMHPKSNQEKRVASTMFGGFKAFDTEVYGLLPYLFPGKTFLMLMDRSVSIPGFSVIGGATGLTLGLASPITMLGYAALGTMAGTAIGVGANSLVALHHNYSFCKNNPIDKSLEILQTRAQYLDSAVTPFYRELRST